MNTNVRIGDVLIAHGYLSQAQLSLALEAQKKDRTKRLGEILISLGYITEEQLLVALSDRLSLPIIDLAIAEIDLEVVRVVPKALSTRYNVIAVSQTDQYITLAVNDPLDFYGIEDVKSFFDRQCELVLCKMGTLQAAIRRSYSEIEAQNAMNVASVAPLVIEETTNSVEVDPSQAPIVNLVNSIIIKGYSEGASDIHFEPFEKQMKIRLRIDGQLLDYMQLEANVSVSIATRIKILSELDIAERRIPQDGNFKIKLSGVSIGIRVSVIPTAYGEKIVLRFLSRSVQMDNASQYGMNAENYKKICRIMRRPHGLIYITGPTGSGKTTTLYMMVEQLAKQTINVSTIEDPIERNLANVNQIQVNPRAGLTFESGLRSMLRQDPDVILVGETRDTETAQIAVSSAITGHLVLSTLHTNDAISSIVRLNNMGAENYLLANALAGVVAQRLVKKVCPFCKEEYTPSDIEKKLLPRAAKLARGRGCNACNHSGYKGRIAVHEVLEIDREIREMIANTSPMQEVYSYVRANQKMSFLQENVAQLVYSGITTVEEYLKHRSLM